MKTHIVAWRNIGRNIRRTALSATAIMVAAFTMVFLFSLINGVSGEMKDNLIYYTTGNVRIQHQELEKYQDINPLHFFVPDTYQLIKEIQALDSVSLAIPRLTFGGQLYSQDSIGEFKRVALTGYDPVQDKNGLKIQDRLISGNMPTADTKEVVISKGLADKENLKVGDKINLSTYTVRRAPYQITLKISGIVLFDIGQLNANMIYIPMDLAQYIVDYESFDGVTKILVVAKNGIPNRTLAKEVQDILDNNSAYQGLQALAFEDIPTFYTFLAIAEYIYGFMGLIFFLLASTVIINTTMMVIFERTREIGTLSALGMKGKEIVRLFFTEAFIIAIIGSLIGVIIGSVVVTILSPTGIDFREAMQGMDLEVSGFFKPRFDWLIVLFVFVSGVIVSSLAAYVPAKRAARIKPVEALRKDY